MKGVTEQFGRMIAAGMEIRRLKEIKDQGEGYRKERNQEMQIKFAEWSDDDLISHWNNVGCDFNCDTVCCEDVHWELNRRGRGSECAV